jgi:hypothetical protein
VGFSSFDPIQYRIILLCIYEFVLRHRHHLRPIHMYELVKLHNTNSRIQIGTKIPQHSTNSYIRISLITYTTKSHVQSGTKYQQYTIR